MYHSYKVLYTNTLGITSELINIKSINIARVMQGNSNTCNITLTNINKLNEKYGDIKFIPGEEIQVYASRDEPLDITENSQLIGKYLIMDYSIDANKQTLLLKCKDRTFFMLNKIYVYRDDQDRPANWIINNIVQVVNSNGSKVDSVSVDIASTKSNGASFNNISFVSENKTAYEAITELSQPDLTGDDKAYQFWLDADGTFHWQYPDQTINTQILKYCSYPVYEMKIAKAESETAKMIIFNSGYDLEGEVIQSFAYNVNASQVAEAMITQPMTEISRELRTMIKLQYGLTDTSDAQILTVMTNTAFRNKVIALSNAKCDRIFAGIGVGNWGATIRVFGDNYQIGGLYTVVCNNTGFVQREMRLKKITHYLDDKGWLSTLELEEE